MPDEPSETPKNEPEHLIVGQVVAPFGVKGTLKVNILTEFPERFRKLDTILLAPFTFIEPGAAPRAALDPATVRGSVALPVRVVDGQIEAIKPPSAPTPYNIESTQVHKGQFLLKLEGVDGPDEAEALRGCWLLVPREGAKKLPRGSYYIYQIVGLDVYTEAGEHIGKVDDVIVAAANDVYVVKGPGVQEPSGELLVPAIKAVVKRMEMKRGRMVIADPKEWT